MRIEHQTTAEARQHVYDKLIQYNARHMPKELGSNYEQFGMTLKDDTGNIKGGVLAEWRWNWMHVDILWVDDTLRGQGWGSKLLGEIERLAVERNCECIELNTYSFQAPEFYRKNGYDVVGVADYLGGTVKRYYMSKRLDPNT